MRPVSRNALAFVLVALTAGRAHVVAAQTTTTTTLPTIPPASLCTCTGGQCLVTHNQTIDPGTIDFGTCGLVIDTGVAITVSTPGTLEIAAGSLTLNAQASIVDSGGSIVVNVPGTIVLAGRALIDVSAADATNASIELTAGDAVTLGGRLTAQATDSTGNGGTIDVTAGSPTTPGDVVVDDRLRASGGGQGSGGSVCLTALYGGITVNASIDATGGEYDGGCIDLEADGALVVNDSASGVTLDVSGGGASGSGGMVTLDSNVAGDVRVNAPVLGLAGGSTTEGGGDGGELDCSTTAGNVIMNAPVTLNGGEDGGGGGTVDLEPSGDLVVTQPLLASGTGPNAVGGDVTFFVTGDASLSSLIDVSATGNQSQAGTVSLNAPGFIGGAARFLATSEIDADSAPGTAPNIGGWVQLDDGTITIDGLVHANGGGGLVGLLACGLTIDAGAQLQADGTGTTLLQASGPMTVRGTLVANANTLDYLDATDPPSTTGATITPSPAIALDVPPFASACQPPTTTTTTSSSTTTTSMATTTSLIATTTTAVATTSTVTTTSLTRTSSTATTTSTTRPAPTTSTTTRPPVPVTTTTAPPTGSTCTPPRCDDRGPCEPGTCMDGTCVYTPLVGFDRVGCRLDEVEGLLQTAPAKAIRSHALDRKLVAKVASVHHLVDSGRGGGRRGVRALRQADRGIRTFIGVIESAVHAHKIDPGLATDVLGVATDARANLAPLLSHP